jgi:hypothetical protein
MERQKDGQVGRRAGDVGRRESIQTNKYKDRETNTQV